MSPEPTQDPNPGHEPNPAAANPAAANPAAAKPDLQEVQEALAFLRNVLQPPLIQNLAANGTWEAYAKIQQAHSLVAAYLA
jgi:DNA-binding GntR family transcriptional regulator